MITKDNAVDPEARSEVGGTEIEVTPAMIAAGIAALPFLEPTAIGSLTEETLVSRVYRAMCSQAMSHA